MISLFTHVWPQFPHKHINLVSFSSVGAVRVLLLICARLLSLKYMP